MIARARSWRSITLFEALTIAFLLGAAVILVSRIIINHTDLAPDQAQANDDDDDDG